MAPSKPQPLTSRKFDLFCFLWFCHMIPIMLFVDSVAFIPVHLRPTPLARLHSYYLSTYKDPLAIVQPAWYCVFALSEYLIQLPISIWALGGLRRDDPRVPLWVGLYGLIAAGTTWTCIVELVQWYEGEGLPGELGVILPRKEKRALVGMFVGYACAFTSMAVVMGIRIKRNLEASGALKEVKKDA